MCIRDRYGVGYQSTAPELPSRQLLRLPRVGLYQGSIPNADEGWTRYVFDGYGIPYVSLGDAEIRQGDALKAVSYTHLMGAPCQQHGALGQGTSQLMGAGSYCIGAYFHACWRQKGVEGQMGSMGFIH